MLLRESAIINPNIFLKCIDIANISVSKHLLFQDLMFSEEDAEYSEALKMGPICAIVMDGDAKEPHVGMVTICRKILY